jgi:hypothetical protein
VGDCVAATGEDEVDKTDCSSPEAEYRVLAVKEEGTFLPSFACQDVPATVSVYSEISRTGRGFTLCLGNK